MNCQDIARLADTGSFQRLSAAEQRQAAAHARTCRHCAPTWGAHEGLAELRVPPMPAEFANRVRTLAALPARQPGGTTLRRFTLIAGLAALAAAAALLTINLFVTRAPQGGLRSTHALINDSPSVGSDVTVPDSGDDGNTAPAPGTAATTPPVESRLLLLPPDYSAPERIRDLVLQKVADQHPELVSGPETDDSFMVVAVIRVSGALLSAGVRLMPRDYLAGDPGGMALYLKATEELDEMMPREASRGTPDHRDKGFVLPNGRTLRAEVNLTIGVMPDDFDMRRTSINVLATVRRLHADLLLPASGREQNSLTVFLAEDGSVLREDVERTTRQARDALATQLYEEDAEERVTQRLAQHISRRLSLDIDQLGLMGMTTLVEGSIAATGEATGNPRLADNRRTLTVFYAWPRRGGESAPVFGKFGPTGKGLTTLQPKFDEAAAVKIIQREIPDAFTLRDAAAGMPGVLLNSKGEPIRAGRLQVPNGKTLDIFSLMRQLVPDVDLGVGLSRDVTDETGVTITVVFAWEKVPDATE